MCANGMCGGLLWLPGGDLHFLTIEKVKSETFRKGDISQLRGGGWRFPLGHLLNSTLTRIHTQDFFHLLFYRKLCCALWFLLRVSIFSYVSVFVLVEFKYILMWIFQICNIAIRRIRHLENFLCLVYPIRPHFIIFF